LNNKILQENNMATRKPLPTREQLQYCLKYDPISGFFTWIAHPSNRKLKGTIAGGFRSDGYIRITFMGASYMAHNLAYIYMTGKQVPTDYVLDHADTNRGNNAWLNLRLCTALQNSYNTRKPPSNTSGVKGVSWAAHCNKWKAAIVVNGKSIYLGLYDDLQEAEKVVRQAREKLHGEFTNHGDN
jgi:hypothetical protein